MFFVSWVFDLSSWRIFLVNGGCLLASFSDLVFFFFFYYPNLDFWLMVVVNWVVSGSLVAVF